MRKKYKILILFFIIFSMNIYSIEKLNNSDFQLIISENMKKKKDDKIDINIATKSEMLSRKIAGSYVEKIIEYREITGGFEKIEELKRIKGMKEATYTKLSKLFKVEKTPIKNNLYINSANDEILMYYGFSKNEIKEIKKFIQKNGRIVDNIELKKIISKTMYEKLKDKIRYEEKKK